MRPKIITLLFALLVIPVLVMATGGDSLQSDNIGQQLAEAEQRGDRWKTAFFVMTALYFFVYIMGRRRLVRKIWARNKALKLALDKAKESDRMKTAFIQNMSHEIRTPLNAINGFSQILCSPEFELNQEERQDLMHRISKNSQSITNIVAEVLDMSEGESMHDRMEVAVNALCSEMIEDLKHMDEKGLNITYATSLADDFTILSNAPNIRRILRRLLDNAVKFTEKGSVTLTCETIGKQLVMSVADTGIGIDPKNHDKIFENFYKLDNYVEGVGLGLTLSRRLARSLGGDVTFDRTYIGGSRFLLSLPLTA